MCTLIIKIHFYLGFQRKCTKVIVNLRLFKMRCVIKLLLCTLNLKNECLQRSDLIVVFS